MKVAVYGASGYQGKLVAAELARRDIQMVLAARNITRLTTAAADVGLIDAELRIADTDNPSALLDAFGGCDVVINCAGPFTQSGSAVIRAAIKGGCHYVDTAGEQYYIKKVFDTFAAEAERGGVTVVPAVTDGGVPGDLIAHLLARHVEPVAEITTAHTILGGGPSRGSLRTMLETIDVFKDGGLTWDDGDWHEGQPGRCSSLTFPGSSETTPVVKFPLPEVVTVPRHTRVRYVESVADAGLAARLSTPITQATIDNLAEGPTEDSRRKQRFTIVIDAVGVDGRRARGVVQGVDTYGTTAAIAVEGARRLVAEPVTPGVRAPAEAYDPAGFLDFLDARGARWTITTSRDR
jgi:short subunit dehydrogenase-like uncharacterized protein